VKNLGPQDTVALTSAILHQCEKHGVVLNIKLWLQ